MLLLILQTVTIKCDRKWHITIFFSDCSNVKPNISNEARTPVMSKVPNLHGVYVYI